MTIFAQEVMGSCPICADPMPTDPRYPRRVCASCMERAVDDDGRPVSFFNEELSGGIASSSASTKVNNGRATCRIDAWRCVAEEARFGGIVIQVAPISDARLEEMDATQLLTLHSSIIGELQRRGILRSRNNPTGDYGEWLVSTRLGLELADPSAKGFDAIGPGGRYQIKARRMSGTLPSTQLGVIRNLAAAEFDYLVAILFDSGWRVRRAARIPHAIVGAIAKYRAHVNGHVLHLRPSLLLLDGVDDITTQLQ